MGISIIHLGLIISTYPESFVPSFMVVPREKDAVISQQPFLNSATINTNDISLYSTKRFHFQLVQKSICLVRSEHFGKLLRSRKLMGRFWYFADRASQYIYLNTNQLDALNFIMSSFHASTCFEHNCSSSGGQNCIIQHLVSSHL